MTERFKELATKLEQLVPRKDPGEDSTSLVALRAAAAELLLATTGGIVLDRLRSRRQEGAGPLSSPAEWMPVAIAPLTAAAHLLHARKPTTRTATALRALNAVTLAVGGLSLIRGHRAGSELVSVATLGFVIDAHERRVLDDQRALRRKAAVVERLVPRRRPRLDRVVVHV